MTATKSVQARAITFAAAMVLFTAGCATKGFVKKTVDPIEKRVETVEEASAENESDIQALEAKDEVLARDISRVDERAGGAQGQADTATTLANEAGREAEQAQELAEDAHGRVDDLKNWVENLENFDVRLAESIRFTLNSSELTEESKTRLAEVASSIADQNNYVVEVRGFTDTTGPAEHNLHLSRERADAVVRFLTAEHNVPLYRIHTIGLGSAAPAADNNTRQGRQQNRRVEVTVYTAKVDRQMARQ